MSYVADWRFWLAVTVVTLVVHWAWSYFMGKKGAAGS